jgi:hypothetical protein
MSKNIAICAGKGFHMTFNNGYGISVQFGWGNYSDNYDAQPSDVLDFIALLRESNINLGREGSNTAEIAILTPNGDLLDMQDEWGDDVKGYVEPNEILKWMNYTSKLKGEQ